MRPESLLVFSSRRKLPLILQTESSECGLACLAMIAGYHGMDIDLISLRRSYSVSSHGATLKQVMDIASKLELSTRALRLETEQLKQIQTPCILHWELKHFVVLTEVKKNSLVIHDPATGIYDISIKDANKLFTGVALELIPTPAFKKIQKKSTLKIQNFWSRIVGLKRSLAVIFTLTLLMQLFAIISPFYMQTVIDDVILRKDTNLLLILAIGFSLLLIIQSGTDLLRETVLLKFSSKLSIQMSSNVLYHLIRLPMEYFEKRHMGDIVSRFSSLGAIRELITKGLIATVIDGLMAVLTLIVMFLYDITLSLVVICVIFIYALLRYASYRPTHVLNQELIIASAKESTYFMESIRAIQTIKLFEKETDRQSQWLGKYADSMSKGIRIAQWNIGFSMSNRLLFGFENVIVIYLGASAVMGNMMSVGMLYAFMSYKGRFISSVNGLIDRWVEFRMLELHIDRLADILLNEKDEFINNKYDNADYDNCDGVLLSGEIVLKGVSFSYSTQEESILEDVNLTIYPGETVALVGPSGSGKSTLLKIMMGLMKPAKGALILDGKSLTHLPNYRNQIAGVMQEDKLFSGTIADNISCFDANVDMQKITLCAQMACIHDEVLKFPMQYNTLVGDMGSGLSGGQQQRVMIARAFYKQPRILFMDEATSHLDLANEIKINENISSLKITRVIVAHRPETIKRAQRVFKVEKSSVQELKINEPVVKLSV